MLVCLTNVQLVYITELTDDLKVDAVQLRKKESRVMDSRIGLDYIVENSEYVSKLAAALDTQNETVKKQVFELLSALCAYSKDGYKRAVDTLENYKVSLFRQSNCFENLCLFSELLEFYWQFFLKLLKFSL